MGNAPEWSEMILLLDNFNAESRRLYETFRAAGYPGPVIVVEEDGFLPEDVISAYGYYLGTYPKGDGIPGRPRYFNELRVPAFWEISANNNSGSIRDKGRERGRIFYTSSSGDRLVKVVDWLDEKGTVRLCEHYNRAGALYARTAMNAKGQKVNRTFYDNKGREVIHENFVTGDILLQRGEITTIFHGKVAFLTNLLREMGCESKQICYNSLSIPFFASQSLKKQEGVEDILFWQEDMRPDVPGNMQVILQGNSSRTGKIVVQKSAAFEKLKALSGDQRYLTQRGFIYPFVHNTSFRRTAFILTNSDRVEQLKMLVEGLPQLTFYIAAVTEMSAKLMSFQKYENVQLFPGARKETLNALYELCDLYLDINHEGEVGAALERAFLNRELILGFRETCHNRNLTAECHLYTAEKAGTLLTELKHLLADETYWKQALERQEQQALAETVDSFRAVFE